MDWICIAETTYYSIYRIPCPREWGYTEFVNNVLIWKFEEEKPCIAHVEFFKTLADLTLRSAELIKSFESELNDKKA